MQNLQNVGQQKGSKQWQKSTKEFGQQFLIMESTLQNLMEMMQRKLIGKKDKQADEGARGANLYFQIPTFGSMPIQDGS